MRVFLPVILAGFALLLSSCADTELPHWFSGEPSRAELDAYQGPIEMPRQSVEGKDWPNLADVPARPPVLMSAQDKGKLVAAMASQNEAGNKEIAALQETLHHVAPPAQHIKHKMKSKKKVKNNEAE